MIHQFERKEFDAPLESMMAKLVAEEVNGFPYNIIHYGDIFWCVHQGEGPFDAIRFLSGEALYPVFIGESVEEVTYSLLLRNSKSDPASSVSEKSLRYFEEETTNIYRLRKDLRAGLLEKFPNAPAVKNSSISLENLFDMGDGRPVFIISPAPCRTCNYRCEYCYHHSYGFNANKRATDSWSKAVLTAVERIQRPLLLSMGTMGEPFVIRQWREVVYEIMKHDHVLKLAFVSNLSQDINEFFEVVDPKRIGVVASLHPSEYKNHDEDLEKFLGKIKFLKEQGVSVVVNYVLTPGQIDAFPQYREKVNALGIQMTCNVLRGAYRGKMYPGAFTSQELNKIQSYYSRMPFIYTDQAHEENPYGGRCISGRYGFFLEFDGTLYNCHFARQKFGSIYDNQLMVRSENGFCTSGKCESQTTIGWREDTVKHYRTLGSMHHFIERQEHEIGIHPFL